MSAPTPRRALERFGDYELLGEIASGGMATLYVARHAGASGVERLVAVKRVHSHMLKEPGFRAMFQDEARMAALVRHPNVVRVLDVVETEGELLMVLDYVESVSLSALLWAMREGDEPLPLGVTVRILADVLSGLHAAHETTDVRGRPLGIVHRDFSAQNILVCADGSSQLIDFGIAKASKRLTQTTTGVVKGKVQYMSPEQARGAEVDRRSDLFSAGIVLFEALTGSTPFAADSSDPSAVLLRILLDPIPPASSIAPHVPPALDAVVEHSLERARDERYQTAAEMRDALLAAFPPAPPSAVHSLVERWCGEALAARRERVERALVGLDPTLRAPYVGAPEVDRTSEPVVSTRPRTAEQIAEKRPSRVLFRAGLVAFAAALVLAGLAGGVAIGVIEWKRPQVPIASSSTPAASLAPAATAAADGAADTASAAARSSGPEAPASASLASLTNLSSPASSSAAARLPSAGTIAPSATSAVGPVAKETGHIEGGVLTIGSKHVRVGIQLVSNGSTIPDDVVLKGLQRSSNVDLVVYRNAFVQGQIGGSGDPPEGSVTIAFDIVQVHMLGAKVQSSRFASQDFTDQLLRLMPTQVIFVDKGPVDPATMNATGRGVVTVRYVVQ
jgi:tRNA A-37 threonylcarbamoyl transferase component Bud32